MHPSRWQINVGQRTSSMPYLLNVRSSSAGALQYYRTNEFKHTRGKRQIKPREYSTQLSSRDKLPRPPTGGKSRSGVCGSCCCCCSLKYVEFSAETHLCDRRYNRLDKCKYQYGGSQLPLSVHTKDEQQILKRGTHVVMNTCPREKRMSHGN